MDSTVTGIVAAVVVGILAAVGNYFNNRRGSRGTVKTSQAEDLWQAAEGIRHELADRLKESQAGTEKLEEQLRLAGEEITQLRAKVASLLAEVEGLRSQLATVRRRPGGST